MCLHSGQCTFDRERRSLADSCPGHVDPMERIKALGKAVLDSEEGRLAAGLHATLMAELAAYEASVVEDWCRLLADTSDQKLKQPLLR